jgi:hypothetical protein
MVRASNDTFSQAWLASLSGQNRNAVTIVGFVLRCLALKLAKIAFACSKFQEQQASEVLGSLMVNALKDALSQAWLVCSS